MSKCIMIVHKQDSANIEDQLALKVAHPVDAKLDCLFVGLRPRLCLRFDFGKLLSLFHGCLFRRCLPTQLQILLNVRKLLERLFGKPFSRSSAPQMPPYQEKNMNDKNNADR